MESFLKKGTSRSSGANVASTKISKLSLPRNSTSEKWLPLAPSTLMRKPELAASARVMDEMTSDSLLRLYTFNW